MSTWRLKLLYDGQCPFCRREIQWLRRRDRDGNLAFEDISDPAFDPSSYGLTQQEVIGTLHGVLPDGSVVSRLEAVRLAYQAIGLGWLAAPTGWPLFAPVFDRLYAAFARNRIRLGRLCTRRRGKTACVVTDEPSAWPLWPVAQKLVPRSWIRAAAKEELLEKKRR